MLPTFVKLAKMCVKMMAMIMTVKWQKC